MKRFYFSNLLIPIIILLGCYTTATAQSTTLSGGNVPTSSLSPFLMYATPATVTPIQNFTLQQTGSSSTLTQVSFVTSGSYTTSDITSFALYTNNVSNNMSGATLAGSVTAGAAGLQTIVLSTPVSLSTSPGWTYFFIVPTMGATPVAGHTISVSSISSSQIAVSSGSVSGSSGASGTLTLVVPSVPTVTGGSVCGSGTVTLNATPSSGATVKWFATSTGTSPLGTGNTYVTPSISSTTTYYAGASQSVTFQSGTLTDNTSALAGAFYIDQRTDLHWFSSTNACTINSVDFYPYNPGTFVITMTNSSGTILASASLTVSSGQVSNTVPVTFPLNFTVPAGATNYRLGGDGSASFTQGIYRGAASSTYGPYPATINGLSQVGDAGGNSTATGVSGPFSGYGARCYFYNWNVTMNATSNTRPVVATVNPIPAAITGTPTLCTSASTTLSSTPSGGTWTSSNTAVAIVGTGGVVSGITAGNATITYDLGTGCATSTATVTVNAGPSPLPATLAICQGLTGTLTETVSGGSWSSSNTGVATVGTSGIVTGIAPGSAVITYVLAGGCSTSCTVTVTPPIPSVTGTNVVCIGASTTLADTAAGGGTWSSSNTGIATVGTSGVVTGVAAGNATITFSSSGCIATRVVSVNALPAAIGGPSGVCAGSTVTLTDAMTGGLWTSSDPSKATIIVGTGVATGVYPGTLTITYTMPSSGCAITRGLTVNANPAPYSGASNICVGSSTILTDAGSGTWSSSNPSIANINPATGFVFGLSNGVANITYTLGNGCYTASPINVNALPDSTSSVTGGGNYCAGSGGVHVGLSYANSGISYQLYWNGSPLGTAVPGANTSLDFGTETNSGTYTVRATNPITGCSSGMNGSVTVSTTPAPNIYNLTGGGGYCAGGSGVGIGLDGSDTGVSYQLYLGVSPAGSPVNGTGLAVSFGNFIIAGGYTVIGTRISTGCSMPMNGVSTVSVNALPAVYNVTGGGAYCAGGSGPDIQLNNSDPGITYTLRLSGAGVDSVNSISGGTIDFGNFTAGGSYTVTAWNGTCTATMSGSASIVVNPLPTVYTVTGGGGYCAGGSGVHVGLNFSSVGIDYQLWQGPVSYGPVVHGTGINLDLGLISAPGVYTVSATNPLTTCGSGMNGSATVSVNIQPISFNMTPVSATMCAGGPGVVIGTDNSETGVRYQLYRGSTPVGLPVAGTSGSPVNFGTFGTAGIYTAVATNIATGCSSNIAGSTLLIVNALPAVYAMTGGGAYCAEDTGVHIGLVSSQAGVSYELFFGGGSTGIIVIGTGGPIDFGLQTAAGSYTVMATNASSCNKLMAGVVNVTIKPAPNDFTVTGGGGACPSGAGVHIGLLGSNAGVSYQLYNGSGTSGLPQSGSGLPIDFGTRTAAGTYTVRATDLTSGCSIGMSGIATVTVNPIPTSYAISTGGSYCVHTPGIGLSLPGGSDAGTNYQVYHSGTAVGSAVAGTGSPLALGNFTASGSYTVIATNSMGCTATMPGSAFISIITPATYSVTGGGSYCAGGTGVAVGQSSSDTNQTFQLYRGTTAVGTSVAGTGSSISFGSQTIAGTYIVVATDIHYGCVDTMAGSAIVVLNAAPPMNTVSGGGNYCAGGTAPHVSLLGSNTGISYQLYNGGVSVGSALSGSGTSIDFGPQTAAGTYQVVARNVTTTCTDTMAGSAIVVIKPTPHAYVVNIDNYGNYCAADSGLHITLAGSDTGIKYQLYRGLSPIGSQVRGTGSGVDMGLQTVAGSYNVIGTDTGSACSSNMIGPVTLNIVPLPSVHNVTGGGAYCAGGAGVHIGLDGSDPAVYYELFDGAYSAGGTLGTGAPLDFGLQIAVGNYTVIANSVITDCPNMMFGTANVAHQTLLTPVVTLNAYPGLGVHVWHIDSIRAFVSNGGANPTYQWLINGNIIPGATNESFTGQSFYNNDSVTCLVTASGPCGGNTTAQSVVLHLQNVGVHGVTAAGSDVRLMPNPNNGTFRIKGSMGITTDEEVGLEVVNVVGQVLYSNTVMTRGGNLDEQVALPANAANGMYLLNVKAAGENLVYHFVVER